MDPSTTFRDAVQGGRLALCAELSLQRESGAREVAEQAALFRGLVDGVQVTDQPLAWVQPSALAVSALLVREGLDPVPILGCRDRNRVALQSDLLGLRALGVTSVLLMRGRRVGKQHALHGSTVFDLTGRELIAMAGAMNADESLSGNAEFFIGTGARAFRAPPGWTADSLNERAEAGACFVQTQMCFNLDLLGAWMDRLVEAQVTWRFAVVVSVAALPSARTARWVKEQMPDSKIPDALIERLEQAADPEAEGVAICAEAMQAIAELPGVSGINLMSVGNPALSVAAIEASGLR